MITRSVAGPNDVRLLSLPRTLEQFVAEQSDIRDCDEEDQEDFFPYKSGSLDPFTLRSWTHPDNYLSMKEGDISEGTCFSISDM